MKKVLLAEDNKNFGAILKQELEDDELSVDLVSDGVEAVLRFIGDQSYDMIVFDMAMPRLNGTDAVQIIKTIRPEVAALTFSGNLTDSDRSKSHEAGAVECFAKPFEIAKFKDCIMEHTGQKICEAAGGE
ncbi:MAG: response regulator [Nitrospirae bacterium]|nr:response regulator [Nitrospirota bacterium]